MFGGLHKTSKTMTSSAKTEAFLRFRSFSIAQDSHYFNYFDYDESPFTSQADTTTTDQACITISDYYSSRLPAQSSTTFHNSWGSPMFSLQTFSRFRARPASKSNLLLLKCASLATRFYFPSPSLSPSSSTPLPKPQSDLTYDNFSPNTLSRLTQRLNYCHLAP
jgi:hypothetical protein